MLVYLSKKIAIPDDVLIRSLAWHHTRGWLAVGGDDGLLKVLKLEIQSNDKETKIKGLAAPSTLTMNQTLEAHNHISVLGVQWNEAECKMTSCDASGLIVVWVHFKHGWYEEMVNNRNKSHVTDMRWNREGRKICIVYEDGAIIVGSVGGSRLWGKELRSTHLTHVQWSPNSDVLLFGNSNGEIHIYDSHGSYNAKLSIQCLLGVTGAVNIAGIEWYDGRNGYIAANCPCLAVAFDNGRVQIMRHELDDNPIKIDSSMQTISHIKWNPSGSILAIAGCLSRATGSPDKEISVIQFYNPFGDHLCTLRHPGKGLSGLAWEGTGLRLALGISSFIYFANIRLDYKWCYFMDTLVYAYHKYSAGEPSIIFWNSVTNTRLIKVTKKLLHLVACKDYCLLVTTVDNLAGEEEDGERRETYQRQKYALLLCNSLGTPVETKYIPFEPLHVSVSQTHVAVATSNILYLWHYRTVSRLTGPGFGDIASRQAFEGQDRVIHADDSPTSTSEPRVDFEENNRDTADIICAVCTSEKMAVVGRISGTIQIYSLPKYALEHRFVVNYRPQEMALNRNSSCLSIIDINGVLSLHDLSTSKEEKPFGSRLNLERKEVWAVKWAEDNPDQFALMEKTRMYIFRGVDPEEPVVSSGCICYFKDLQVRAVLMDEIMKDPENPSNELIVNMDVKSLRDTRQLLEKIGMNDSFLFINDNPHPRLWRLLAESALEQLDLDMAEKAFVRQGDYQGIKFVKSLQLLNSEDKQRAEIAAYFKNFDQAEKLYLQMDRKDLAIDMRMKLGDWFQVVQLLEVGGNVGDDTIMRRAWNAIGDYFSDQQKWENAVPYYSQAGNQKKLAECFYVLEDYASLEQLADSLPDNHALLEGLARQFVSVGMCEPAVRAYIKVNKLSKAIDGCIELNQWDQAVSLAQRHKLSEISELLARYAAYLLDSNRILTAVELYRKANRFVDAAKLLAKAAQLAIDQRKPPLTIKKIYVLVALLIEQYRSHVVYQVKAVDDDNSKTGNKKGELQSTLQGLLVEDTSVSATTGLVDNAWKGAEAYHFFILAQQQLYSGDTASSLRTAMVLRSYEGPLSPASIYSLLALVAANNGAYSICSQAFVKLESLKGLTADQQKQYESLGVEIFRTHPPKSTDHPLVCPSCDTPIDHWSGSCPGCSSKLVICTATGQLMLPYDSWFCSTCKHRATEHSIASLSSCPLCHAPIS